MSLQKEYDVRSWCHTRFEQRKGSLTWKIGGFSFCEYESGRFMTSPEFSIRGWETNSWNLRLFPNWKNAEKKDFVAVFLRSKMDPESRGHGPAAPVKCEMSIVDASGDKIETKELTFYSDESAGWEDFVSRSSLLEVKDLLLPGNVLTLRCELETVQKLEKSWRSGSGSRPRAPESRRVQSLRGDMGRLLQDEDQSSDQGGHNDNPSSDVVFEVDDTKIPAHKALLMARSPVFATMFQQDMLEAQTSTVVIKDIQVQVFQELLTYLYTDECDLLGLGATCTTELIDAAEKYNIPSLKTLCADFLSDHLSEKNVFHALACAATYGEGKLRKDCVEFTCRELSSLVGVGDHWDAKLGSSPEILEDIVLMLAEKETSPEKFSSAASISIADIPSSSAAHSRFVKQYGKLLWKISGFGLCCAIEDQEHLRSPSFGIRGSELQCYLELCLNGHTPDNEGCVSVLIHSESFHKVQVISSVCFKNSHGQELYASDYCSMNFEKHKVFQYDKGIHRKELLSSDDGLPKDELVVVCDLIVSTLCEESQSESKGDEENLLSKDLSRILRSGDYADVVLEVDAARIPAHKFLLMSRSGFFAAALKGKENFVVDDMWEEVFRDMLRFMYTDQCSLRNLDYALDLLDAASRYDVPALKVKCCEYLYDHLSEENVIDIVITAYSLQEMELYKYCIDYICQELPSVTFLLWQMKKLQPHPDVLKHIIERQTDRKRR